MGFERERTGAVAWRPWHAAPLGSVCTPRSSRTGSPCGVSRCTAFVTDGTARLTHVLLALRARSAEKMSKAPLAVCITGAAGQIGYALLPHICSGKTFGPDQPIKLHLLDLNIEGVQTALGGVKFELEDSTYPLLKDVVTTGDAKVRYEATQRAILSALHWQKTKTVKIVG